jgi:D-xylonolactonase
MENFSVIADYGDQCGEGPVWDSERQLLYWTDCVGQRFYRYDPASRLHAIVKSGMNINSFALNQDGTFIICNGSGTWLWDGSAEPQCIVSEVDGNKCQLNDSIADPTGRLLAGSTFYDPQGNYSLGKLFVVETNGNARVLDEGIHMSNGLGFSPDCRTLYFTDSAARCIFAYDYDVAAGNAKNRRVFVRVPSTSGLPDGLTVDADGFIWSAEWYGSCIVRYDPSGKIERRIDTIAKQTSALAFGGPELTDIFITSAGRSEALPIMPPNYDPHSGYLGGQLFKINLGIQGKAEFRTNITPTQ